MGTNLVIPNAPVLLTSRGNRLDAEFLELLHEYGQRCVRAG